MSTQRFQQLALGPHALRPQRGAASWRVATGRRPGLRPRRDGGSATVELTAIFPVLLLLIVGLIQGGLYWHSRNVALAAAQEGLAATRVTDGTTAAGSQRALGFIAEAGGSGVLTDVTVTPTRTATTATVQVSGSAIPLLGGLPGSPDLSILRITVSASGPVERYQNQ